MSKKSNPLSSRQEVVASLHDLLGALDKSFPQDCSRFSLGETCAHYPTEIAQMEGLSRALWGLFPLMAGMRLPPSAPSGRHGSLSPAAYWRASGCFGTSFAAGG